MKLFRTNYLLVLLCLSICSNVQGAHHLRSTVPETNIIDDDITNDTNSGHNNDDYNDNDYNDHNNNNHDTHTPIVRKGLYQGDMKIDWDVAVAKFGLDHATNLESDGFIHHKAMSMSDRDRDLAAGPRSWRWEGDYRDGVFHIPVRISQDFQETSKTKITQALDALQLNAKVVQFDFIESRPPAGTPYIYIIVGDTCSSWLGQMDHASDALGQEIELVDTTEWSHCISKDTIQHEMMHALGFGHEQARTDRDQFVEIVTKNIRPGFESQFDIIPNTISLGSPYDQTSIMHYNSDAFSRNHGATIIAKNGRRIGGSSKATWTDIEQIRLMYQCRSGTRWRRAYWSTPCSDDCKCWENRRGCGGNDSFCAGGLVCPDNTCINPPIETETKLVVDPIDDSDGINTKYYVPGVMFDIQPANTTINVLNFYFYELLDKNTDVIVDIYAKRYSHLNTASLANRWTKIGTATLHDDGTQPTTPKKFPLDSFSPLRAQRWIQHAFYITTRNNDNQLVVWEGQHYADLQNPLIESKDVKILEGCDLCSDFSNCGESCRGTKGGTSYSFYGGIQFEIL